MLARLFALALAACAALGGCSVASINPLFTTDQVVFEPRLVGHWKAEDDDADDPVRILTAGEDKTYRLTMGEKDDKLDLIIRLIKLGDHNFTDTSLAPSEADKLEIRYAMLAVPTHLFAKVDFSTPDVIVYQELDRDWLFSAVHKEPAPLAHSGADAKSLVLSASTKDLQKFITEAAGKKEAWTPPATFKRVTPKPSTPSPDPKK